MPIAILEEHNDLADSVRSYVARVAPSEVLHEALESPIPNPPPYWKSAAEQGLQGVHLAESVGGDEEFFRTVPEFENVPAHCWQESGVQHM